MPRSLAICAIGRPDSSTSRTARSRSSSGYFFGAGIAETVPLPRMKSWLGGLRQTRPGSDRGLPDEVVEGRPQVMHAIPEQDAKSERRLAPHLEALDPFPHVHVKAANGIVRRFLGAKERVHL